MTDKQTTIEWLRKELETIPNYSAFYTNNYTWIDSIMNEAKEMEKEQLIMFGAQCMVESEKESGLGTIRIYELYFNKTFKSE